MLRLSKGFNIYGDEKSCVLARVLIDCLGIYRCRVVALFLSHGDKENTNPSSFALIPCKDLAHCILLNTKGFL